MLHEALDDFPQFRDPDGGVWVWDSESHSYTKKPSAGLEQDRGHATGGDNDLFNQSQIEHSELAGVPELEGHMARFVTIEEARRGELFSDEELEARLAAEWAPPGKVLCPQCHEATTELSCPHCGKDLTPEWNNESDKNNEFHGVHPQFDGRNEFTSDPERVPKRNREKTDDSYPSMSLSKNYAMAQRLASRNVISQEDWDDFFAQGGSKVEIGKWLLDRQGQFHFDHGMHALHENIAARDGLQYPADVAALGSVYNDGSADTQRVDDPSRFNVESVQSQITQAFGPVTLQPPVSTQSGAPQTKGVGFQPVEITGGQWLVAPNAQGTPITGTAWVKGVSQQPYNPRMILVAEHLQPEDYELYSQGCLAIITATGGMTSHAAYLASTEGIPTIVGLGAPYNKIENGNYLKIDPSSQTITVMPGADSSMSPEQKQQVSDSYVQYQMQHGGSLTTQFGESPDWIKNTSATLDNCPECSDVMHDQDGEKVCHGCGHKQPIIHATAAVLAPLGEAAIGGLAELGGGAAAGGAAAGAEGAAGGGGISGIGGLMNKALNGNPLQTAFYTDKLMGGGGEAGGAGGAPGAGEVLNDPAEMQGVISKAQMQHEAGVWGTIIEHIVNALGKAPEALVDPKNPLSYADDVAGLAAGAGSGAQQQFQSSVEITEDEAWGLHTAGTFGDEETGTATKNRGENSDPEHDGSGASFKEKGDSPELLKDIDGPGDAKGDAFPADDLANQGDPALQEKALKSLHMNLPLVIEFSKSDEAGADNPILQALDAMLEEAFPGYKGGTDPEGEQKEHPLDEPDNNTSEDESGEKPDDGDSSNGDEKKPEPKEASVWNFIAANDHPADCTCPECEEFEATAPEKEWLEATDEKQKSSALSEYDMGLVSTKEAGQVGGMPPNGMPATPMGAPAAMVPQAAPVCPMCGQTHAPGTACPAPAQATVTAPAATGQAITPPQPNTVVTKWHVVSYENPAYEEGGNYDVNQLQPCPNCGQPGIPAQGGPCQNCGADQERRVEDVGPAMGEADRRNVQPMHQYLWENGGAGEFDNHFGFYTASEEPHQEHETEHKPEGEGEAISDDGDPTDIDSSSDTPWVDDSGAPITEGMDYEMKANSYAIPDRVTVDRILPDKIQYTLHGGDVDYQDSVTKEQLDLDGISFTPVGGDSPYDSEDGFQDYDAQPEAPVRPGQDATPQVDDLSTPSTVVSNAQGPLYPGACEFCGDQSQGVHKTIFGAQCPTCAASEANQLPEMSSEPYADDFHRASLDNYTGSYRGDAPDDRSWLMEDSSPVAVDPELMAKFAAKDFSPREQREFIEESGEARNLDRLDLEGTHYVTNDVDAHFNW